LVQIDVVKHKIVSLFDKQESAVAKDVCALGQSMGELDRGSRVLVRSHQTLLVDVHVEDPGNGPAADHKKSVVVENLDVSW